MWVAEKPPVVPTSSLEKIPINKRSFKAASQAGICFVWRRQRVKSSWFYDIRHLHICACVNLKLAYSFIPPPPPPCPCWPSSKIAVLWQVIPCSLAEDTHVHFYQNTQDQIPESNYLHNCPFENLRCHPPFFVYTLRISYCSHTSCPSLTEFIGIAKLSSPRVSGGEFLDTLCLHNLLGNIMYSS
jgi:hypothetical protein